MISINVISIALSIISLIGTILSIMISCSMKPATILRELELFKTIKNKMSEYIQNAKFTNLQEYFKFANESYECTVIGNSVLDKARCYILKIMLDDLTDIGTIDHLSLNPIENGKEICILNIKRVDRLKEVTRYNAELDKVFQKSVNPLYEPFRSIKNFFKNLVDSAPSL